MRRTTFLVLFLFSCAETPPTTDQVPTEYAYGPLRNPVPVPVPKAEPFVPPAGKPDPEEPEDKPEPPKKSSPCTTLCGDLQVKNDTCASWTTSCQRLINANVPNAENSDTCINKKNTCDAADRALTKVEDKNCDCRNTKE